MYTTINQIMNIKLDRYDEYLKKINSRYIDFNNPENRHKINEFITKVEDSLIVVSKEIENGFKGKLQFNKDKTFISIRASEHIWLTLDAQTPTKKLPFMFLHYRSFEPNIPFFNAMFLMEKKETIFQLSHNNYLDSYVKEHEVINFCKLLTKEIESEMKKTFDTLHQNNFVEAINHFYNFICHNKRINFEEEFIDVLNFKDQEDLFFLKYDTQKFSLKKTHSVKVINKI